MMEILHSHTNVIAKPGFDHDRYGGINSYALGFAMYRDIRRICESPTDEDRRWFPDFAGSDWRETLDFAMRNSRTRASSRSFFAA
jgi:stage V sporulation protein R